MYVINYASDTLVQINKATQQVNQIQIPVTSADEEGYGLALSGSHLFFTLADDYRTNFAADSTFGYVDISSWRRSPHNAHRLEDALLSQSSIPGWTTQLTLRATDKVPSQISGEWRWTARVLLPSRTTDLLLRMGSSPTTGRYLAHNLWVMTRFSRHLQGEIVTE